MYKRQELRLNRNDEVTERNREIYRLEAIEEQVQRERVNAEMMAGFAAMADDDDYGDEGGSPSICGDQSSLKYNDSYCSINDEGGILNTQWDSCKRDRWLDQKYSEYGNRYSWLPGYKSWKKERGFF